MSYNLISVGVLPKVEVSNLASNPEVFKTLTFIKNLVSWQCELELIRKTNFELKG